MNLLIALALASAGASTMSTPTVTSDTKKQLSELLQNYEKTYFETFPEQALDWHRADAALDRFSDHSLSGVKAWQKKEDYFLAELGKIKLESLKETKEYQTAQILKETLENHQHSRICHEELWEVNPLWGWHNILSNVAEKQPVGTPDHRAKAIQRWKTVNQIVDQEIENLKHGLKQGYSAPKPAVQRVIKQLEIILKNSPEESPFFDFAKRDGNPEFKKQVAEIITQVVHPSLVRYQQYLEKEYLPHARTQIGVSALPAGEKCYHAKIKQYTTLAKSPKFIYEFGHEYMEKLKKEIAVLGQKEFGVQELTEVFKQAKIKTQNYFKSEKQMLDYNLAALARAQAKVPEWFDRIPKAPGTLKPYPLHRAQTGAAGEYHPPSEDGSEPGIFYINTYQPETKPRLDQEATLFHELIPGHHFQIALSIENKSRPSLDKYLWNSGFGEGWALYVERLADEMGLYGDSISRLGMLSSEAFRAARLVVDPGIHVMNWSREKAIQYMKDHTAMDDLTIEGEVDRYIMAPGQATSYMLGRTEIFELREMAKKKLGSRFDMKQFHNHVLQNGTVTLPLLRAYIENWVGSI